MNLLSGAFENKEKKILLTYPLTPNNEVGTTYEIQILKLMNGGKNADGSVCFTDVLIELGTLGFPGRTKSMEKKSGESRGSQIWTLAVGDDKLPGNCVSKPQDIREACGLANDRNSFGYKIRF